MKRSGTEIFASFLEWVERLPGAAALGAGLGLVLLVGWVDFLTGPDLSLSFLYLIPISLLAWARGWKVGLPVSILCAGISLGTSLAAGPAPLTPLIAAWNALLLLATFLLVMFLVVKMRIARAAVDEVARVDTLTGGLTNRAFYEVIKIELDRARRYRHPFTLAYLDLDDFAEINDKFGYSIGDAVLRTVGRTLFRQIRTVDVLARLGGDEFGILLPETGPKEAEALLARLHRLLTEELNKGAWPTGLSMGATVFLSYPAHVDDIIHMADHAMASVKAGSKSAMEFTIYQEEIRG
ncbi:MAG: GGDEF domain-containing protein [Bacteroidota bacterium]